MPRAYAAAERFWSYPILIIVFVGAWRSHNRRIANRPDSGCATPSFSELN
jgi:hypothetical protein